MKAAPSSCNDTSARARVFFCRKVIESRFSSFLLLLLTKLTHARHAQKEQREIFSFLHFFLSSKRSRTFFKLGDLFCVSVFSKRRGRGTFPSSFVCILSPQTNKTASALCARAREEPERKNKRTKTAACLSLRRLSTRPQSRR